MTGREGLDVKYRRILSRCRGLLSRWSGASQSQNPPAQSCVLATCLANLRLDRRHFNQTQVGSNKEIQRIQVDVCPPQKLCFPCRVPTFVNEIHQSKGAPRLPTFPLKAPLWRKPKLRQQWWMDIINVVHLQTFYSAIWENEGSTAKGKCACFGTPVPESYTFGLRSIRTHDRVQGPIHSTSWPQSWSRIIKPNYTQHEVDLYV